MLTIQIPDGLPSYTPMINKRMYDLLETLANRRECGIVDVSLALNHGPIWKDTPRWADGSTKAIVHEVHDRGFSQLQETSNTDR